MPMRNQTILSRRLQELCEEKGMSYYILAYRSAVPITTIMNIVNCVTKNPGVFTVIKLCGGLGITAREFFDADYFCDVEEEAGEGE